MYVRDSSNNKNVLLEVDGSNQLSIKDVTAQAALSSIDSKCATAAHQVSHNTKLDTIATNQGNLATAAHQVSHNTKLDTIATNQGNLATAAHQVSHNTKLDAINTTLQGTISVSSSAAVPARASGNIATGASKSAGDLSSSVNGTNYRKAAVFGSSSSNTAKVKVHLSHDNSNFYEDNQNQFFANASNGHIAGNFELNAPYFKIEFVDTATYTLEYSLVD